MGCCGGGAEPGGAPSEPQGPPGRENGVRMRKRLGKAGSKDGEEVTPDGLLVGV